MSTDPLSSTKTQQPKTEFRVAAITQGKTVPSRRFRVEALVPYMADNGIYLDEFCPRTSSYPPENRYQRPWWFAAAMFERASCILPKVTGYDAVILQRELISTLATIETFIPGRKILDVDDAIYLHRKGVAARHAAKISIGCVCGNSVIAERFSDWSENVAIIPTGVDTNKIKPQLKSPCLGKPIIGWIGTSGNLKYLERVSQGIKSALDAVPESEFQIITDNPEKIPVLLKPYARFIPWEPDIENSLVPQWTVGIMPLDDGEWERGKCAFKMLQYMAAGVAVVASPVGMNRDILQQDDIGFGARNGDEWAESLVMLLRDPDMARRLGQKGRALAERCYSLEVVSQRWRHVLTSWVT